MELFMTVRRPVQVPGRVVWVDAEFGLEPAREGQRFVVSSRVWASELGAIETAGQVLPELRMAFPELRPVLRWHNAVDGVPHRYLANAWFWYGLARADRPLPVHLRELRNVDPTHAFAETILLGTLRTDPTATELLAFEWPDSVGILNDRLPPLKLAFWEAMAGVPKIAERLLR